MATIETKYVDVGFFNGQTKFPDQYGFSSPISIGTLSNTANGSSDPDVSGIYSSVDAIQVVWFDTNSLQFAVEGVRSNSGWDSMTVGSTTVNRSDAGFATSSSGNGSTTWTWSSQSNPFGTTVGADVLVTWDDGAASIVAPTISSVTNNNASAANVTATVNLSSNGSGGTLKYAQTTTNSVPASGWQTGNTFSHPRGTTRYYWASQDEDTSGAFSSSTSHAVGYIAPDTAVSPSNATIAHDASSASITITGVTSGETYQLRNQTGTVQYQSGTASSTSITISQTGGLPSAGSSLTYQVFALRPTSLGGDGAYDATGDTYTITRSAAPVTTGSFDLSTSTITEGGSLTVQNISTSPSGGYHLKLFRNSGDSPDSISPVTKTWTGTSTANFTMSVANQSASEIGYQGESFTWLLREGTDTSAGWDGGASLDSADFTLYDDEHGTSISDSTIDISYTASSFTVGVVSNWSGTNTVAARIRNTSTDTVVKTFNITTNSGTTNVSVTSGLPAAAGGSSSNYRVEVYNGNAYLDGATFSVTRAVESVTTPTDIAFGTNSTASATVSITATASGGSGGTLQVSENNSTWVANGSSFTFTRGTAKTIYARRTGSGANSSSYSESHTVGYLTGDTAVSATSSTIAFTASSAATTVSGGQSAETYAVRVNNGATNLGTRTGNGSISFSLSLPSGGNTTTYEIFVRRPTSTGGDGSTFTATNDTFTVTRTAADGSPNAFSFTDVSGVARSTTQTSNQITISGIDTTVAVSITGGTYSKNGGSYTSSAGTAVNGDTFTVRHTSSSSFSTAVNTTLNVGGTSDTYTSTTLAADTTPNAFSFTDVSGVARSTTQTSNQITIAGMNTSASVSITGGTYSKNGGSYTSSSGTAVNNDTFTVRHTSSSSFSTAVNTTLTVGGTSDTYTSTTLAEDTTPNAFSFTDVSGVAISTTQTSNTITVAGLNSSASVSITGGTYSKNGGSYTSSAGTAVNGDTFSVRHTSSSSYSTAVNTVLTIGGVSDTYTSTTQATPTYSINAPASINEGSAGTINVTTTNVANNTTLYWDLDLDGDYSTSEGTVTITSNAGSFTITPDSDSSTEGAETDTIRLYSDSGRTTQVATDSFTINDTSTGAGGSSTGADGTDTFGLNVYGPDGSTIVFSSNFRTVAVLSAESVSIAGSGGTKTYTGITDADDSSKIAVDLAVGFFSGISDAFTISRSTANGGTITVTNDSSTARTVFITITRLA